MADTVDHLSELKADGLGHAVEASKRHMARKAANLPDKSRVCNDIPCLSHTYLISTKIDY